MDIYSKRRNKLLSFMEPNSIAIISASHNVYRNNDVEYPFRQSSNFWYLTGSSDPQGIIMLVPHHKFPYIYFGQDQDPVLEKWHGSIKNINQIQELYQADLAFYLRNFVEQLELLLLEIHTIYHFFAPYSPTKEILHKCTSQFTQKKGINYTFFDLAPILSNMRIIKDDEEIVCITKANEIIGNAFQSAIKQTKTGIYEYEVEATLMYEVYRAGASFSFPAIVASGENACILHYSQKSRMINNHDLVLIDAGAEYNYYASDITRTIPANKTFTTPQLALYNIVLQALNKAIAAIKPGVSVSQIEYIVIKTLTEGLVDLGIIIGKNIEELIANKGYRKFFYHAIGHFLGLDVHEKGLCGEKKDTILCPNMVLALEPGLYMNHAENIPKDFLNIGIRIEDNILITEYGCKVLSAKIPKDPKDLISLR